MGTASDDSGGGIVGDCDVGTIVWVRRRNGSWWPGRVLGVDELAESQLMSPRSGTPVKLLGREDASVDWYNLEKSKRVKPFRCGEFDACIEKAEASYNTPSKKREKYARREDAILHALELERHQLERKENTDISYHAGNMTLNICERGSNLYTSEVHVQSKPANRKSQTSSVKLTSFDEYYLDHPFPVHRNKKGKASICEYDNHEIAAHTRVEDAGPEVFKSKGKLFHSIIGGNLDITDESRSYLLPQSGHDSVLLTQAESAKNFSVLKRKSLLSSAISVTPAKRRDRRRPLVKVLQYSTKFPVSYSLQFHHDCTTSNMMPVEEDPIGITLDAQKDTTMHSSSDADNPLDYSGYSWKDPPNDAGNACHMQQSCCMPNESTPSGWTEENEFDSSATDSELEIVEENLRTGIPQCFKRTAGSPIDCAMSQWHLKGKRNLRAATKKLHGPVDEKNMVGADHSIAQLRESSLCNDLFSSEKEIDCDTEDDELFTGLGNRRDDLLTQHSDFTDSDDDKQLVSMPIPSLQTWSAHWEEPEDNLDQFHGPPFIPRIIPMLVDVNLKVQGRCKGVHVPLISIMSKLNGKAIIGHPVRIEVLEDGSTDLLLSSNEPDDGDITPLHVLTSGGNTSMPHAPQLNLYLPNSCFASLAPRVKKKSIYHSHRSASGRFQRKPLKTVSLSSSKKTRPLSSFVPEAKPNTGNVYLSGFIESDGSIPILTCIPIKMVFSRILESVGRPSSAGTAAEKGPS